MVIYDVTHTIIFIQTVEVYTRQDHSELEGIPFEKQMADDLHILYSIHRTYPVHFNYLIALANENMLILVPQIPIISNALYFPVLLRSIHLVYNAEQSMSVLCDNGHV